MTSSVPAATLPQGLHISVLEVQRRGADSGRLLLCGGQHHACCTRDSTTLQTRARTCESGALAPCLITVTTIVVGQISPQVGLLVACSAGARTPRIIPGVPIVHEAYERRRFQCPCGRMLRRTDTLAALPVELEGQASRKTSRFQACWAASVLDLIDIS